ncbi:MAG: UDP-N-acetylglucosamine 2-epimerase (non-hydrolyzing), partial [Candidatus Omnitrophica bacterium]|nr:UDP-N-acetylglucosamine 2-epimerase (non-hydrolyzing) [Candidatus Omnitrophota bacterium]
MKIVSIVGARPQFIKASAVSKAIKENTEIDDILLHTGQHFDWNMSQVFLTELNMNEPKYCLNINGLTHGAMVGRMIEKIEEVLIKEAPDLVLVYGDTNSTLAGALAAKKLSLKVAHIEAGLRSFDMHMPEEINRVLTDRISDVLFCPTATAIENLKREGQDQSNCRIIKSGDVMKDIALFSSPLAKKPDFPVPEKFILVTMHRAENTDNQNKLESIIRALNKISHEIEVVFPIHPRTHKEILKNKIKAEFEFVEPVGYLQMLYLLRNCQLVATDSGGLQ